MNVVTKEVKEEGERTDGMKNKDGERVSWRSFYNSLLNDGLTIPDLQRGKDASVQDQWMQGRKYLLSSISVFLFTPHDFPASRLGCSP
jgi:hypothetical protein